MRPVPNRRPEPKTAGALRRWWGLGQLVLAGLAVGLGQAPWGFWWLALVGLVLILHLLSHATTPRVAFRRGWLAGLGAFGLSMLWIIEPFLIEPERHGWMAPFALVLMVAGMALFWGLSAALAVWLGGARRMLRLWAMVPAFLALEALRGHLFTGFPWAMLGHIWIDTPIGQLAALGGALGLSLLALVLAVLLERAGQAFDAWRHRAKPRAWAMTALSLALVGALLGAGWFWGEARLAQPAPPARDLLVRLVQPNADQALKWDPRHAEALFFRHLDLSAAPGPGGRRPDLVVWPETAVPFFLDSAGEGLRMAAESAGGAPLLLGIQRRERGAPPGSATAYFNSLAVLDAQAAPLAVYDKHHLVPFGEYVPLIGQYADRPGLGWLSGFAAQALLGYTPGPGPRLLDLGAAGRVLPLICYEAIFPRNLRLDGPARPDWLVQITNDAWFGTRIGPFQHLAQARLRAIEQGLPMVRVANTGVSAMIDARGQVMQALGMGEQGVIDALLPGARPAPPYARLGDAPWHLALLLVLGFWALLRLRIKQLTRAP